LKRREFIVLAGSSAGWPFAARAQPSKRLPVVAFIFAAAPLAKTLLDELEMGR
jgi:hypothetical protein